MKPILNFVFTLILFVSIHAQDTTKVRYKGEGKNTFALNINRLEKLIGAKLPDLENQLGEWSLSFEYSPGYFPEIETTDQKQNPLKCIQVNYDAEVKTKPFYVKAEVRESYGGNINKLTFIYFVNGEQLAAFKSAIRASGYYLNENLSHNSSYGEFWAHKSKSRIVTIKKNPKGNYTITIS